MIYDKGFVCINCGNHEQRIFVEESKPERKMYDNHEWKNRNHYEAANGFFGPRTIVGGLIDAKGKPISNFNAEIVKRNVTASKWVKTNFERNFTAAYFKKRTIENYFNIPEVESTNAWNDYVKCVKKGLAKPSVNYLLAACFYGNTRTTLNPPMLDELAELVSRSRSLNDLKRSKKGIWKALRKLKDNGFDYPLQNNNTYLYEIMNNLPLSEKQKVEVLMFYDDYFSDVSLPSDPKTIACSVIYLACELSSHLTQRKIAEAGSVCEVSIRNNTKKLIKHVPIVDHYLPKICEAIGLLGREDEVTNYYTEVIRPLIKSLDDKESRQLLINNGPKVIAGVAVSLLLNDDELTSIIKKKCRIREDKFNQVFNLISQYSSGQEAAGMA